MSSTGHIYAYEECEVVGSWIVRILHNKKIIFYKAISKQYNRYENLLCHLIKEGLTQLT